MTVAARRRARRWCGVVCAGAVTLGLAACRDDTVRFTFDPDVGDVYRFRSDFHTTVTRRLGDESVTDERSDRLDASEAITASGSTIVADVTLRRGGERARRFEVRYDRADRLTAIDLVDGVPIDALVDVDTGLPGSVTSPPDRPLRLGEGWTVDEDTTADGGAAVTGEGRLVELGVVDGHDVAVVEVDLVVTVDRVVDTANGTVSLLGRERVSVRTTYDLDDGAARTDETIVEGDLDVVIEPPSGITSPPVEGSLRYGVRVETERLAGA